MFWKKKKGGYGNCHKCGERKHISMVKKVVDFDEFLDTWAINYVYWCYPCIKADEIERKNFQEWFKKEKEKKRKAWIKERDKLLQE